MAGFEPSCNYDRVRLGPQMVRLRTSEWCRSRSGARGSCGKTGRLLCEAQRAGVHRWLGFASFGEYVEQHFGYKERLLEEKLRVALAVERRLETSGALRAGELNWSAVRELTRVATPETEGARESTIYTWS